MIEQGTQSDENILAELAAAARWLAEGRGVALATVVATWGSSPRPVGSHLVAESQGTFLGSVSGGCIESAVVAEARAVIADGQTRHLNFGVSSEQAWSVGSGLPVRGDVTQHGGGESWSHFDVGLDSMLIEIDTWDATPEMVAAQRRGFEQLIASLP